MFITGISDEAGSAIEDQIRAHKELGWSRMELRGVEIQGHPTANLHDISEEAFAQFERTVKDAGMEIYCFSSTIANWGKKIDESFDSSLAEARRAIARMKRLGTRHVRIMSFAVRPDEEDQMATERFRRLRELVKMFGDEGLVALHENCMNYGGMGWPFTLELLAEVPGLKLVFDTGNPVFADDRSKPQPWRKQSAWEFYEHVRDHVEYVHIKDGVWNTATHKTDFCFPGEGEGDVERIIADLAARGYDGGFSIEPHMTLVYHEADAGAAACSRIQNYVEYGRRLERLIGKYYR